MDTIEHAIERCSHFLVQYSRVVALYECRLIAVTTDEMLQFFVREAGEETRVGDLPAIQVQDGQHRAVRRRVEKLVRMPACGERSCFRLAVTDDAGNHEIRVVECRTKIGGASC